MKDKDFEARFPWTLAFLACSICYFGFIRLMKFINVTLHPMFLWMAIISFILGCISGTASLLAKKRNTHSPMEPLNPTQCADPAGRE